MQRGNLTNSYELADHQKLNYSGPSQVPGQHASQRMAMMNEIEEQERKIVNEFCHLLEKSKQLFNGLRDLPQYGHRQWQAYFGRTFDVYTRLWKFQQQHRQILDIKYGLKRWQIGEIASKIGQLYYHYYLRTSETNYLNEAFSFYAAIRARGYYSKIGKEDSSNLGYAHRSDLMVKKLRYYARFIVVCLLLKKMKLVRDLVRELAKHIDDYTSTYEPEDQLEWSLVLGEIKSFIEADNLVNVLDVDSTAVVTSHRLGLANTPPMEKLPSVTHYTLQEILIVGNCCDQLVAPPQVKFSELTLDMFRMLQTLEREPQADEMGGGAGVAGGPTDMMVPPTGYDASPANSRMTFGRPENGEGALSTRAGSSRRENPHKYLLYRPTFSQLLVFLASGFKEMPAGGALLLYLSADGCFPAAPPSSGAGSTSGHVMHHPDDIDMDMRIGRDHNQQLYSTPQMPSGGYDNGGVATNNKRDTEPFGKQPHRNTQHKEMHCLYPGDLSPFLRKPLFLIVDSDNSHAFENISRHFGQAFVALLSPEDVPPAFHDHHHKGNLFTLFLHCPLSALCFICHVGDIPLPLWDKGQHHVHRFMSEASRVLIRSRSIDPAYLQFYGDDFLRLLILRFVFCHIVLKLHRMFKEPDVPFHTSDPSTSAGGAIPYPGGNYLPRSYPPIPESEVLHHPALRRTVLELTSVLDVRSLFIDPDEQD